MEFLIVPVLILVGALLIRFQKLQADINAVKIQNERIIKVLEDKANNLDVASANEGEETL